MAKTLQEELMFGGAKTKRWLKRQQKGSRAGAITPVEYTGLQAAYDHFNKELFEGKLPDVFITYQRKARSLVQRRSVQWSDRQDRSAA